jgi:hypothetical protein
MKNEFIETEFRDEPLTAIRMVMQSHATGQMVLNVSQGTVVSVKWREKVTETTPHGILLDRMSP